MAVLSIQPSQTQSRRLVSKPESTTENGVGYVSDDSWRWLMTTDVGIRFANLEKHTAVLQNEVGHIKDALSDHAKTSEIRHHENQAAVQKVAEKQDALTKAILEAKESLWMSAVRIVGKIVWGVLCGAGALALSHLARLG